MNYEKKIKFKNYHYKADKILLQYQNHGLVLFNNNLLLAHEQVNNNVEKPFRKVHSNCWILFSIKRNTFKVRYDKPNY